MAQLPPKIPNLQPSWPDFSYQKFMPPSHNPAAVATNTTAAQNPSWVDEFLDFSSARRGTHRRSMSDSIAFLEAPLIEECRGTGGAGVVPNHHHHHHHRGSGHNSSTDFDKFDDEQFMSMFTDDFSNAMARSCSNPSTPSDHNSFNDDKDTTLSDQKQQKTRNESDEVQSQCQQENQIPPISTNNTSSDRISDPKRVKRYSPHMHMHLLSLHSISMHIIKISKENIYILKLNYTSKVRIFN